MASQAWVCQQMRETNRHKKNEFNEFNVIFSNVFLSATSVHPILETLISNLEHSENHNTCPLVRKQVDFLADKLIFQ